MKDASKKTLTLKDIIKAAEAIDAQPRKSREITIPKKYKKWLS